MTRYIWLGLVQGFTEFLPISSSAHLLLAQRWWGMDEPGHLLVSFAHLGTLLAVLLWFRQEVAALFVGLWRRDPQARRYWWALILGTLPLAVGAAGVRGNVEQIMQTKWVPVSLLANGLILVWGGWNSSSRVARPLSAARALGVGVAQLFAIIPGLSRSGLTISFGLRLGLKREEAFRFSFLLGIPAILGSAVLAGLEGTTGVENWTGLTITGAVAFASGFLAISILSQALRRNALWPFGLYCFVLGGLAWALA